MSICGENLGYCPALLYSPNLYHVVPMWPVESVEDTVVGKKRLTHGVCLISWRVFRETSLQTPWDTLAFSLPVLLSLL